MMDEDYQVSLSDGQMFGPLWVLGAEDAPAGGRQKISPCFFQAVLSIVCMPPQFKLLP